MNLDILLRLLTDMFREVTSDSLVLFLGGDINCEAILLTLRMELLSSSGTKIDLFSRVSMSACFLLPVKVMSTGFTTSPE